MRRYFRGNTPARNRRIAAIHKKFLARQRSWVLRRLVKHNSFYRKGRK